MKRFLSYHVAPRIPENLDFLETLARNLWWSWNNDASLLFERLSPRIFREVNQHPLRVLARVDQERLEMMSRDAGYLRQLQQVEEHFQREVAHSAHRSHPGDPFKCIAYFSLEYGLHHSLRLYSGGLGVLAGDHLKSASDLDLPLAAVGLLYREGYFEQHVDADGRQQEHYPENDLADMPVSRVNRSDGTPLQISVPVPEGTMDALIWRLDVGRVPLFLLDTIIPSNPPELRNVTGRLYGGDRRNRLYQELLLGIGGDRALQAMGYTVAVSHMNEGHAAFMGLSRQTRLCAELEIEPEVAHEIVRRTSVFTTHTPVPAGNETFEIDLLRPCLAALETSLGIPAETVIRWGRAPGNTQGNALSMTVLGFNLSRFNNGVSRLHGEVERRMWTHLWPEVPVDEIPIRHITNGVHVSTWLSPENADLCERYLGPNWQTREGSDQLLHRIEQIPDEELWHVHELGRARLVRRARDHYEQRLRARNASRGEIMAARTMLNPDALTIGFARRFATYKRARLILSDVDRLTRLLADGDHPIQLIFAGKAHPADEEGKALIQEVVRFVSDKRVRQQVLFLDDYDLQMARHLVRGVDVWLNTPRRPHEASGTSGMKVCINGGLHFSVLDGWWCEGYSPACGWAIGQGEEYRDEEFQDLVESQSLYNTLENEIIPCFYERAAGDVPSRWVTMMKASMRMGLSQFSSHRMVREYNAQAYREGYDLYDRLIADRGRPARELVDHHRHLRERWEHVRVEMPEVDRLLTELHSGDAFTARTRVDLAGLAPETVDVQLYYGPMDLEGQVTHSHTCRMEPLETLPDGRLVYHQTLTCDTTGRFGFTVRVKPRGNEWEGIMPGYVRWVSTNGKAAHGEADGDSNHPDGETD